MKNLIKCLAVLVILTLLQSCKSYKFIFAPSSEEIISKRAIALQYIIKKEELFLVLTNSFKNEKVKVLENNNIIYDDLIETDTRGKAKVFEVNINSKITMLFDGIKDSLKITPEQMKLYKYIYLSKNKKKVTVEFSNGGKDVGSLPPNQ